MCIRDRVTVTGGPGDAAGSSPYEIELGGSLAGTEVPRIVANDPSNDYGLALTSGTPSALVEHGALEICVAADGDVCRAGEPGQAIGQIGASFFGAGGFGLTVSQPDGDPANGTVFLADEVNRRINTYTLDGADPDSIGSAAQFGFGRLEQLAIDSRGILYASNDPARR